MIKLDERGKQCPIPVIETKKQLEKTAVGETVQVLVDNEIAKENLQKFAGQKKLKFTAKKLAENEYEAEFIMTEEGKKELGTSAGETVPEVCGVVPASTRKEKTVVVISSDSMGEPEKELGAILLKGFLFALSRTENMPETILFYNGGAKLTCEGSESLEDLKALQDAGCEILTCGTCLDYQHLKEKLKVGGVTNMYDITEKMLHADRLVRP